MNKQIKLVDIAKIALSMEERGYKFYSTLAEKVNDIGQKQMIMKLAEDEKEHRKLFEKIIMDYSDEETLDEETYNYLRSIQKNSVFPEPAGVEDFAGGLHSLKDVVAIGIQAEKDAILIFHELTTRTRSEKIKKILYDLLEEEKMHLVELRSYLEELDS
jgi:rubrerythrin